MKPMTHCKVTSAILAIICMLLAATAAAAKQLRGEEITDFLVGNTVEYTHLQDGPHGTQGTVHAWVYYASNRMRKVEGEFRFTNPNGYEQINQFEYARPWRVSAEDQICYTGPRGWRKDQEVCKNISIDGDRVILIDPFGTIEGKLHQGNPRGM